MKDISKIEIQDNLKIKTVEEREKIVRNVSYNKNRIFNEKNRFDVTGELKITNSNGEVVLHKKNAIHYENMTLAIARALSGDIRGHIHEMHFGNGGTTITGDGTITYLPPNITGNDANLYNPTYFKIINQNSPFNSNPSENFIEINHLLGETYTDIIITATLDFNEPAGQPAFDNITNLEGDFVFDEIGLKAFSSEGGIGELLTYVNFAPVAKSLNIKLKIEYIIRINVQ
jgi:hypothetical protein